MTHERSGSWWLRPFSVVQTNLQEIDAAMDVDSAVDFIEDYGADTWLLNVGGIVSFYPTDLPFQTRNPYLASRPSGDLVGDALAAAHARGIKVIARLDLSKVSAAIAAEHPEWLFVSPEGEPQIYNGLYTVCPSGGYYQERSIDVLDEIIDRYPVDGFFFNWFNFGERDYSRVYRGVCHCDSCRTRYAERGVGELPVGPQSPGYWEWLRFTNETTAHLTERIVSHIRGRRPDVALVLRKNATIAYEEASNSFGEETWHHATSAAISALVASSPQTPVLVNSVSFVDMPYRMAAEQPERYAHYLVQTIARGGHPSTYFMGAPGRIPYANLPQGAQVNRFYRRHGHLYEAMVSAARIALVRPNRFAMRPADYVVALAEFRGIYAALQQLHHPFDVLAVESLAQVAAEDRLRRYQLVIVPDPGALGEGGAAALDAFVIQGGHLVVTGAGGTSEAGVPVLATSPALSRVGEVMSGNALWSTYATLDEQDRVDDFHYRPSVVPVYGSAARFEWKPETARMGHILPAAPYGPPERCFGHILSADPAAARLHHGRGSVTSVPWTVGATYREFGTTEVRTFFARVIAGLADRPFELDIPEQVEVVVGEVGDGTLLHLLNFSGARHRSFGPPVTIHGGLLRCPALGSAVSAEALVAGVVLTPKEKNGEFVFELPPLDLFEVVHLRGYRPWPRTDGGEDS